MSGALREEPACDLVIRAEAAHAGVVGDPGAWGPEARAVLGAARRAGDREAEIVALRAVAWFERSRLANVRARALLDAAVRLARGAGLDHRLGEVLATRAAVQLELGRTGAARRDLDRAAGLVDGTAAPDATLKRAALLHNVGLIAAAAEAHAGLVADPAVPVDVRTRAANNLALEEALLGRTGTAMEHLDRAADWAREVGPAAVAVVAHNRGQVLAQSGRLTESLRRFDEALELVRAAGLPEGEFLADHAETLAELRALPEAQEVAERAAAELESADVPLMAAQARLRVAEVALLRGDVAAARAHATDAAARFRRQRRPGWTAQATVVAVEAETAEGELTPDRVTAARRAADTLARLGLESAAVHADLVCGRAALALGLVERAVPRLDAAHARSRQGAVLVRLRGSVAAALAASVTGDDARVLAHCRAGLADLARHRAALASAELRALAGEHGAELGELGLAVLLRAGGAARIGDWVERTRAVALLTTDPPAPDAAREDRAELAAVHAELVAARGESGAEPVELLTRQRAAEQRIRRATWGRTAAGGAGTAVPLREVEALLGDRTLVSYLRAGPELAAVVLGGGRRRLVRLGEVAPVAAETEAALFALRRLARPQRRIDAARLALRHSLARLTGLLVEPLGVEGGLVVVPAAGMHRIPWAALHPGPVAVAPSASLWARTVDPARGDGEARVLVVGGPGLPGAAAEVAEVASVHPGAHVLGPADSETEAVLAAMAGADLVHLACHGRLRADNPTFSALEVADGPVLLHELDLRGIAPRRIVLAACDSAAGTVHAGDELLGFVSALLARGTAGVVASIVAVPDLDAVGFMRDLHAGLARGLPMAEALHGARALLDPDRPGDLVNAAAFAAYGAG